MDRRAAVAALGAAAFGSALKGSASPGPRLSVGRLKQSVSRWPYRQIPLPEFARAAVGMGLAAIDLLGPEDWDPVREAGLVCSMGYPTARNDFIATGLTIGRTTGCCCGSWRRRFPSPRATGSRM